MDKPKRKVSLFFPIKIKDNALYVFLQKRSADMENLPNYFGPWGGGADENETSKQTLIREIKEELNIDLDIKTVEYFNHYEFLGAIQDVYIFKAPEDWEKDLVISEGDYGQWLSSEEVFKRDDIIFQDKVIINDLERRLLNKKIK